MPERMRKRMVDKEMINGENGKMLRNDPYEIRLMQNLYDAAVKQLSLKFEILNNEFKVLYARNPIHHIEGRVKAIESMVAKLRKKGLPPTIEAARESINDIAGVRVVCSYIDDVYRVAEMVERQTDIEIIKRQDYIRTPNYNGYRSLHLDIRMPVYLSGGTAARATRESSRNAPRAPSRAPPAGRAPDGAPSRANPPRSRDKSGG